MTEVDIYTTLLGAIFGISVAIIVCALFISFALQGLMLLIVDLLIDKFHPTPARLYAKLIRKTLKQSGINVRIGKRWETPTEIWLKLDGKLSEEHKDWLWETSRFELGKVCLRTVEFHEIDGMNWLKINRFEFAPHRESMFNFLYNAF